MTHGIQDTKFIAPVVETGRITNVNIEDWTVDAISEHGDKKYFDIQMMSPYLHYINGEGIYAMPEVGALVWVCTPSEGLHAIPFILGFQAPHDEDNDNFASNRSQLNPGDMMMKTRDENFIILRRGGGVQIGATPSTQRMYIPTQNFIRDFCENYQLFTFGGELTWVTDRTEKTTDGDVMTKLSLLAKEKAKDEEHIVELTIGSHGEGSQTTLNLLVKGSGAKGADTMVSLEITKEGNVNWEIQKDVTNLIHGNRTETIDGNHSTEVGGTMSYKSAQTASVESDLDVNVKAGTTATLEAAAQMFIDGATIHLGGPSAAHPLVHGDQLVAVLSNLIAQISTFICPTAQIVLGAPAPVIAAPGLASVASQLPTLLSTKSFTA